MIENESERKKCPRCGLPLVKCSNMFRNHDGTKGYINICLCERCGYECGQDENSHYEKRPVLFMYTMDWLGHECFVQYSGKHPYKEAKRQLEALRENCRYCLVDFGSYTAIWDKKHRKARVIRDDANWVSEEIKRMEKNA